MARVSFTETLRTIDDAGLDPYEFRLWVHVWRVGVSWESLRTVAQKCNMSLGKAHEARKTLLERGLLAYQEKRGRLGLTVVLVKLADDLEQEVAADEDSSCSPDEHGDVVDVHDMNAMFTTRTERSPHEQNVHQVNAILSMPYKNDLNKKAKEEGRVRVRNESVNRDVSVPSSFLAPGMTREREDAAASAGNGKRELTAEEQAYLAIVNAITDVTGVSAKLNWAMVSEQAANLRDAGFTAEQLIRHYSKERVPGVWNWYVDDWRGQRGSMPTYKTVSETIAAATATVKSAPARRKGAFDLLLEQAGTEAAGNG